jgi:hypothetical protein
MPDLTLESLAARVAELERKQTPSATVVSTNPPWLALVGSMEDNEFTRDMIIEMEAIREADRRAAWKGLPGVFE